MFSLTKIKEMIHGDKKTIILTIGCLLAGFACWYLFGHVSDQRARTDAIRNQLDAVSDAQQSAIKRLDKLESGLADSAAKARTISAGISDTAKSVADVEKRISDSQGKLRTSAEIINDCQRILEGVRERGQTGTE